MSNQEGGRRIKVVVSGLPEAYTLRFYVHGRMRAGDLAVKLRLLCYDIKETDKIQIYQGKFLLPDNERISIIETGEEIIAYIKTLVKRQANDWRGGTLNMMDLIRNLHDKPEGQSMSDVTFCQAQGQ